MKKIEFEKINFHDTLVSKIIYDFLDHTLEINIESEFEEFDDNYLKILFTNVEEVESLGFPGLKFSYMEIAHFATQNMENFKNIRVTFLLDGGSAMTWIYEFNCSKIEVFSSDQRF